jgi:hypothetical protein
VNPLSPSRALASPAPPFSLPLEPPYQPCQESLARRLTPLVPVNRIESELELAVDSIIESRSPRSYPQVISACILGRRYWTGIFGTMKSFETFTLAAILLSTKVDAIHLQKRTDGPPRVVGFPVQRKSTPEPLRRDRLRRRSEIVPVSLDNEVSRSTSPDCFLNAKIF